MGTSFEPALRRAPRADAHETTRMTTTTPARIGRPPKVTHDDIARAALAIGLDRANIRNVADALGMSATGLYHHVRTREQLVELAAEHSFARMFEQAPKHGSFADLLTYFARAFYELFVDHPRMVSDIYTGQITITSKNVRQHEWLIDRGVRSGFTPFEAHEIYTCVMGAVVGAATIEASDRALASHGSSFLSELGRALERDGADAPHCRELAAAGGGADNFEKVRLMLQGLSVRYGERLSRIVD
jgi:AcrR family transcriptional regulator